MEHLSLSELKEIRYLLSWENYTIAIELGATDLLEQFPPFNAAEWDSRFNRLSPEALSLHDHLDAAMTEDLQGWEETWAELEKAIAVKEAAAAAQLPLEMTN